MPVFAYVAIDLKATRSHNTIVADTPRAARDLLRDRGMRVESLIQHADRPSRTLFKRRRRFDTKCISFVRELATLLGVGIPLLEALDNIARQHRGAFQTTLLQLRDQVAAGASLTEAMKRQPDVFDEFCINLTEVGENAGTLDSVLDRLAEFKERSASLKDRVTTALLYPSVVLTMAIGVSLFLMTFVVPNLLDGLTDAGQEIPWVTRIVKSLSDLLIQRWWMLLGVIAIAVFGIAILFRSEKVRLRWHEVLLRLPVVGDMARKQAILRIAVSMSTLMRNGVVFGQAIRIAQRSTPNLVIRGALQRCEAAVNGGQDISRALEATRAFPPVVVQLFAVGQQSGRLEDMLDRLATSYDLQLTTAAQRLTSVLEPILILFLVLIVGFIALATVLPMLEAANVF